MTLSFQQAFRAKESGRISWEEYIHNLLARCGGIKHEEDNTPYDYPELLKVDPLGHSIWTWTKEMQPVKDTAPLEAVFLAYRNSTFDDMKGRLGSLEKAPADGVTTSIALLALQDRRDDVLQFCLDKRFPYDDAFYHEADRVDARKEGNIFKMLERSHFRRCYPKGIGAPPGAPAVFDVGGRLPVDW